MSHHAWPGFTVSCQSFTERTFEARHEPVMWVTPGEKQKTGYTFLKCPLVCCHVFCDCRWIGGYKVVQGWAQWLTSIIPVLQEAEAGVSLGSQEFKTSLTKHG